MLERGWQTESRQSNSTPNFDQNIFGKYGVQPTLYISFEADTGIELRLKNLPDVTGAEAEQYAAGHRKSKTTVSKRVKEIARLAKDFKASGADPNETIGSWWKGQTKKSTG